MDVGTDSNSDLDEELPFVLSRRPPNVPSDWPAVKPSAPCHVMTISSDSEDDAPYVPLALRLQHKRSNGGAVIASSNVAGSPKSFTEIKERQNGDGSPVRPRDLKRTAEEIQMSKEEALRRRREREETQRPREETQRPREETQCPRKETQWPREETQWPRKETQRPREETQWPGEVQRTGRENEKAQRRALAAAAKALRPEECIKYMVAVVDPALLQLEGGGALLSALQTLGCSCSIEKQPLPRSVSWRRRNPGAQSADGDGEQERNVLIQMTLEDFINLSRSYVQEEREGRSECGPTLSSWVQELQRRNPEKDLSLVVLGLEQYFRSNKAQSQKKLREAVVGEEQGGPKKKKKKEAAGALPELSRVELEEAVVHLQLATGVCVRFLATWKDFTEHVAMATKAVAEAPFKRERDNSGFSFYLESEWAGGQKVDRGGKGLLQVWRRQVQQLNRVSADMANAVLALYPSPRRLAQAFHSCHTEKDKMALLSEIQIRRGEGVTSTVRRVGPELSKRLCVLMTSTDPEQTLGN